MRTIFVMSLLGGLLLLNGCMFSEEAESTSEEKNEKQQVKQQEEEPPAQVDLNYIKDHVQLGLSKQEVEKLFGMSYTIVTDAIDGNQIWRYDLSTSENYVFISDDGTEGIAAFDRNGLISGTVQLQLFIGWTEQNAVKDYAVYYLKDGKITEYRLHPNGEITEVPDV